MPQWPSETRRSRRREDDWTPPGRTPVVPEEPEPVEPEPPPPPPPPTTPTWDYKTPEYTGPGMPDYRWTPVPGFDAPEFQAPSFEEAQNEPGYRFRLNEGSDAMQRSAAARGVLRGGGTLQDILKYGQNFASSEYSNVWDRAARAHEMRYQGARDEYAPGLMEWQTRMAGMQRQRDLEFQRAWDQYTYGIDDEYRRMQMFT